MTPKNRNIFLDGITQTFSYTGQGTPIEKIRIIRDRSYHGNYIKSQFERAWENSRLIESKSVAAIKVKDGMYIEFKSALNNELSTKSLENISQGIRLLNVREEKTEKGIVQFATVFVPSGKENYFIKKTEDYLNPNKDSEKLNPKNKNLIESIDDIKLAMLGEFWTGNKSEIPKDVARWCEIWLRVDGTNDETVNAEFETICQALNICFDKALIVFPERLVKIIRAQVENLKDLLTYSDKIAEIRLALEPTSFFVTAPNRDQKQMVDDLLGRTTYDIKDISVCLFDTGINNGHMLLENVVSDSSLHTVDRTWGIDDKNGHGTAMAGIVAYHDLKEKLISKSSFIINHSIESVKILPPPGRPENRPELYGAITTNAMFIVESANPVSKRIFCNAITADDYFSREGRPSSWSAQIDNITSGAIDGTKRLFFVSAGNLTINDIQKGGYPEANYIKNVESPAQSWNAISVGAFSKDINITEERLTGYSPLADSGDLSPFSATSCNWISSWPIKPEILMDGGNVATNGTNFTECDDLSLLTTNHRPLQNQFTITFATSAAAAQAAQMAAKIKIEYPEIWDETLRALIVSSAKWTDKMKKMFCSDDKKTTGRRLLLRTCGYGIPDLNRALECLNNNVNMVIQSELQPFEFTKSQGKMKEMHIHDLPWPSDVLKGLEGIDVKMKVTLSYFIEPGPGEIGWQNKYRYASCGLRFDVNNKNETKYDFAKRVNIVMRGEDKKDKGSGTSGTQRWFLGSDNRDVGSIHSDIWEGSAVDFCDCNFIAVYPTIGWWRERTHLKKCNKKIRYALVISLSTPSQKVDFLTPIKNIIENKVKVKTEIVIKTEK
ncbi:MAG: S8 family peptidase [Saccharofermentanales bacterium]